LPKSAQIVAARGLLGMEQRELAHLAGIHVSTLVRLEGAGWNEIPGTMRTVNKVLVVLEHRGVLFSDWGVELTKKPRR
jgi:predicted transcriptional regulator